MMLEIKPEPGFMEEAAASAEATLAEFPKWFVDGLAEDMRKAREADEKKVYWDPANKAQ